MEDWARLIYALMAITLGVMCTYHAVDVQWRKRANRTRTTRTPSRGLRSITSKQH